MHRQRLPIEALPAWVKINDILLDNVSVQAVSQTGYGLVASKQLTENPLLVSVPKELILSMENVWILAKADKHLREVLEAMSNYARTPRGAILIFLLLQISHTAKFTKPGRVGLSNAFTSYIQFLPSSISIPTCWNPYERSLLVGTSLEAALEAKLNSLNHEFSSLRDATSMIPWCQEMWWDTESGSFSFEDWKLIDAFYRSRALDLPGTGHVMVPCIDFANHASGEATAALYDTDSEGNAVLLLRDGKTLMEGNEITITYGDEKGACEMLFSYGFLEPDMTSAKELYLDLEIPNDDPLKIAKKHVSKAAPGFRIYSQGESAAWEGPFVWLLCVNEEDGLEFKLLQKVDGDKELKVYWKDSEIVDILGLELLLQADPRWDIFRLRAAVVLRDRIAQQLSILRLSTVDDATASLSTEESGQISTWVTRLRNLEEKLLLQAYNTLDRTIDSELLTSEIVQQYLNAASQESEPPQEDDFS